MLCKIEYHVHYQIIVYIVSYIDAFSNFWLDIILFNEWFLKECNISWKILNKLHGAFPKTI